jgi:ATP-dependent Lon protease
VLSDEALRLVISRYTREAGVRQLERAIGRVMRKVALKVAEGNPGAVEIRKEELTDLLGPERFLARNRRARTCRRAWQPASPGPKPAETCSTSKPRC